MRAHFYILTLFLIVHWVSVAHADENGISAAPDAGAPWNFVQPEEAPIVRHVSIADPAVGSPNAVKAGLGNMIVFFQNYLSPVDGPKCPHYPTCSQFARESVGRHGAFWGTIMSANRLTREYPGMFESGHYKLVWKGAMLRAYDPPEDHWLWE